MIKTTKLAIATYWQSRYPEMNLRATHCWRCGIKKRLDRCHIQAASIEGSDCPENFVLLCKHCHIESPNIENPGFMWQWLQYYNQRHYEALWFQQGVLEYERMSFKDLSLQIQNREDAFMLLFEEESKRATRHFGQPALNPATVAGIIFEVLKKL